MYLGATEPRVKVRQRIEKRIVLSAIRELLARGFSLAVDDGECTTVITRERKVIVDAIMNTDEDYLEVYEGTTRVGWIRFVYGNDGYDVISDYTIKPRNLEEYIPKTLARAERLGE